MSNIDKIKKLALHLRVVDASEIERRKQQAENQPRDEHGRFIAIDPSGQHADDNQPLQGEMNADDLFQDAEDISMDDINKLLGLKKSEQHSGVVDSVVKQAASQIKEHGKIAKVQVPENITGSFSAYKQHPHSKNAYALKYLIHRLENVHNYNTPDGAIAADKDFIKRREQNFDHAGYDKGDLKRLNQYSLPELHRITMHSHLLHGLLEHRDNLHAHLKQKQANVKSALSDSQVIKNINGEPHVALLRGLDYGERKADPLLASYSDTKQTLGDRVKVHHAHWVPLKNVWYSYNHGPKESHPNPRYPHQDEYLVSPHELKTANQYEVKQMVPPKITPAQRKRASDTAVSFKKVTAGRHPQSPAIAAKPAADPGKPPERPHVRADSQSVVNFRLEKSNEEDTSGKNPKLKRALVDRMVDNNWKPYFRWLTHPKQYNDNGKFATEEDAIAAIPPHVNEIIVQYRGDDGQEVNKKITKNPLKKSIPDKPKEGQFFVDFPQHSHNKTKAKGGWATWHFTKKEVADILRNWDDPTNPSATFEWRGPFPRPTKEGKRHPTAIGRPKVTAPIQQHIDEHQGPKVKDVLYHGAGQDKVSHDALKENVAHNVDVYDPFQDANDPKDVWKRDIRQLPDKKYDQVHSHYTFNVVDKNGPKQGKEIFQEIHDRLNDNGKAVITVRRDDICKPAAKPKLVQKSGKIIYPFLPLHKSFGKDQWQIIKDNHFQDAEAVVDHEKHFAHSKQADPEYIAASKTRSVTPEAQAPDGVSPKMLHTINEKTYMSKPYQREPENWDYSRTPMHLMGWSTVTNHNLYNAANIGHLCEEIHTHAHKGIPMTVHPFNMNVRGLSFPKPFQDHETMPKENMLALQQIAVMDYLTHNGDRHGGNIMTTKGTGMPLAIDHERSFQYSDKENSNYPSGCFEKLHNFFQHKSISGRDAMIDEMDLQPLRQWWNTNKDNLVKEFQNNIAHIKLPSVRKHITDNFMMRLNKLDDWSKNKKDVNLFKVPVMGLVMRGDKMVLDGDNIPLDTEHIPLDEAQYWDEFNRSKHGSLPPEKPVDVVAPKEVKPIKEPVAAKLKVAKKPHQEPTKHGVFDTQTAEQKMPARPLAAKRQKKA